MEGKEGGGEGRKKEGKEGGGEEGKREEGRGGREQVGRWRAVFVCTHV